jgi:putative FmdB family regulatory protein
MPIYEYRCGACGFQKEFLQRLNEKPLTVCPECGKRSFNKMVTAAGFQLKGTGWYATDFRGGTKPAADSGNSGSKTADTKAAEAKTDKPAAEKTAKDSAKKSAPAGKASASTTDSSS